MKKINSLMTAFAVLSMVGTAAFVVGCRHMDSSERSSVHVHQYTCSMHPEITQDSPGTCPKCGMALMHKD